MSGGHFDYKQHNLTDIADEIEQIIRDNKRCDYYNYSSATLKEFKKAVKLLRQAKIYTQRVDWLISGDDDEDDFHERIKEDLKEFENE